MNDRPDSGPPAPVRRRLASVAEELMRLARQDPAALTRRVAALSVAEQAELALRLPAKQRLELLLHAPRPLRLVRALPDSEVYLTVRELGPADALPLLGLASASQLNHIVDLETWRRDRFDADRAGGWIAVLLESGEPALRRFLRTADDELLALLLRRWVRVEPIEYEDTAEKHGHGEGDAGTELGFLTPDGEHRFSPTIPEHAPAIRRLLQIFFVDQPVRYQRALWAAVWELPSELEESAYHWRQSRLEEHGFPPWEEALSVYAPPQGDLRRPAVPDPIDPEGLRAARTPLRHRAGHGELIRAIDRLDDPLRERVLFEIVSLANHVLVADGADTGDPERHTEALEGVLGCLDLAMHTRQAFEPTAIADVLAGRPALELFREGHACAVELQDRARRWLQQAWPAGDLEALRGLDSPVRERIAGLLETRPRYADLEGESPRLRPFHSRSELDEALVALELAELFDRVFARQLGIDLSEVLSARDEVQPRTSSLLLTIAAWHATRDQLRGDPLPDDVTAEFLRNFASRRTAAPDAAARAVERTVGALTQQARLLSVRESAALQSFGRFCFERLREECGNLDPGVPPSAERIRCLLLERG